MTASRLEAMRHAECYTSDMEIRMPDEAKLQHFLRIAGDITASSVGGALLGTAVAPVIGTIIGAVAAVVVSSLIAHRESATTSG
ncbi:MAG: hypothetical protein QOC81_1633 [Thermoanaerobaculia bacterium]|jgi:hypothetical protein|nr:hypothetical protein [Thermoanaerobaculia bacterium]